MTSFRILVAVLGMTLAATASAEEPKVRHVTLEECIQMALQNNLGLKSARYNPQIALYDLNIAKAGYDPVFTIAGEHSFSRSGGGIDPDTKLPLPSAESESDSFRSGISGVMPWGLRYDLSGNIAESYGSIGVNPFDETRGSASITMAQPLLKNFWIDGTRLAISVSKIALKQSELGLRWSIILTINQVENAYFDLIAARENVRVQEQALQLAERLAAENKRRVEVGALAPLDEKQAEAQAAAARTDLAFARQALGNAQNLLRTLISDEYRLAHDVVFEPVENLTAPLELFDLQESWSLGMTERPDLLQAKLDVERQGVQLRYSYNQLFPQLDLIGSYGHSANGSGVREFSDGFAEIRTGDRPFYSYGAQLTIPFSNKAARNRYRSAKATLEQIVIGLKQIEQNILAEIDVAVRSARASYERVGSTRQQRLYAEAALEAEQKKLENGKSTSFIVLQLQRDLTLARSAEISALAEYNKALAELARAEGTTLERRRVDLEIK